MNSCFLPEKIEIDGALELLRFPDYQGGWAVGQMRVTYDPRFWLLPSGLSSRREDWQQRHPNERSDPKVALRRAFIDDDGIWRLL